MATSSLKKKFVITSKTEASNLAKMLSDSLSKPYEPPKISYTVLTPEQARAFLKEKQRI